jgi:hypothetical protein
LPSFCHREEHHKETPGYCVLFKPVDAYHRINS